MSGHNKWSSIKHKKGATDKKRSLVFSKIIAAISAAARENPNPSANPRLKSLIEQAKASNVPKENIERVLKGAAKKDLKDLTIEAYGPGGVAMIIKIATDNTNRAIAELRHLLGQHQSKIAEPGSVLWSFDSEQPKFTQKINDDDKKILNKLIEILKERDDVQKIITNAI